MERAEALVADMEEQGLEATLGLYNILMDGYARCHIEAQCLNVFHKLKARIVTFGKSGLERINVYYCWLLHLNLILLCV